VSYDEKANVVLRLRREYTSLIKRDDRLHIALGTGAGSIRSCPRLYIKRDFAGLGVVAYACNPSYL
jgi:hypothetical protein